MSGVRSVMLTYINDHFRSTTGCKVEVFWVLVCILVECMRKDVISSKMTKASEEKLRVLMFNLSHNAL